MSGVAMSMSSNRHPNMNNSYDNCGSEERMDVEIDAGHAGTDRGSLDTGTRATCSSNGSGGEEDEAEAADREREATGSSTPHSGDGMSHCGGREQEVSVEIGETYLCQRADKTWRKLKYLFRIVFQKHVISYFIVKLSVTVLSRIYILFFLNKNILIEKCVL